jgi:hypothetical protein
VSIEPAYFAGMTFPINRAPGGTVNPGSLLQATSWVQGRVDLFSGTWRNFADTHWTLGHSWTDGLSSMNPIFEAVWADPLAFYTSLAVTSWGENRLDIFTAGPADPSDQGSPAALWHVSHGDGGWSEWDVLEIRDPLAQPTFGSTPHIGWLTAVAPRPNLVHVFVPIRDPAGKLAHGRLTEKGIKWSQLSLTGLNILDWYGLFWVDAASSEDKRYDLATVHDGAVYTYTSVEGAIDLHEWHKVDVTPPGPLTQFVRLVPRANAGADYPYDLFLQTDDKMVWRLREEGGTWGWHEFVTIDATYFAVVSALPDRFDLFAVQDSVQPGVGKNVIVVEIKHWWSNDGLHIEPVEVIHQAWYPLGV